MKRAFLAFLLIFSLVMLSALESDPSETVGFVKYGCVVGLNFTALSLDAGYTTAAGVGGDIASADQISEWNSGTQAWSSANKSPFGTWLNDFDVDNGHPLMIRTTAVEDFYVAGGLITPEPTYGIVVGLAAVSIPLSRTDLTTSALVGADMVDVDQISEWNSATQTWASSNKSPFGTWLNSFATDIAKPLLVRGTSAFTWPTVTRTSTIKEIHRPSNIRK
jgi:hypothetical protein